MLTHETFSINNIDKYLSDPKCRIKADGRFFSFEDINFDDTLVFGMDDTGAMYDIPVQFIEYVEYEEA